MRQFKVSDQPSDIADKVARVKALLANLHTSDEGGYMDDQAQRLSIPQPQAAPADALLERVKAARAAYAPLETPPPDVSRPSPYEYTQAQQLETQAQPPAKPQGLRDQLLGGVFAGLASMGHPQGYYGWEADRQNRERQREQDLLTRAKELRQVGLEKEKMGNEQDFQQQQLEQVKRLRDIETQKAAQPQFTHFGSAQGGELYGTVTPQTGAFSKQGEIAPPPAKPPDLSNFSKTTVNYQGKPVDALEDLDPASQNKGHVFIQTPNGLQDITGQTSHYEKPPDMSGQNQKRADTSYDRRNTDLEKAAGPIGDGIQRVSRLLDTLDNGSPLADSVTAPELMVVMAGGQGSGVRITSAEINNIMGGQSKWEQAKAALNQWNKNPDEANRILAPMRGQMRALVAKVHDKLTQKEQVVEDARQSLIDAADVKEQRQIVADMKKKLAAIDSGLAARPGGGAGLIVPGGALDKLINKGR